MNGSRTDDGGVWPPSGAVHAGARSAGVLEAWYATEPVVQVTSAGVWGTFRRVAREFSLCKPLLALKSGSSAAGQRAAGSHTAAVAEPNALVDAIFERTGVIRVRTLDELFATTTLLSHLSLPRGNRLAVVSNAGGMAILAADVADTAGLQLPTLTGSVQAELRELGAVATENPVDLGSAANEETFARAVTAVAAGGDVDAVLLIYTAVYHTASDLPEIAELDCNPVMVTEDCAVVVDARIRVAGLE